MRLLASFMGIIVMVQLLLPFRAMADISDVSGKVSCNKIGSLLIAEGFASITSTTISISGKSQGSSQSSDLLQGILIKPQTVTTGGHTTINSMCYFTQGPSLGGLSSASCGERVDLLDGSTVAGPISSISADQVVAGGRTVAMSAVKNIHSPHVFNVKVSAAGGKPSSIAFSPTCIKIAATTVRTQTTKTTKTTTKTSSTSHEHSTAAKLVAVGVVGCVVATAIAVPLAVTLGHHHHRNQQPFAFQQVKSQPPPPVQVTQSSSSFI